MWTRKREGKRPLVRPRHRWEDNIIMDWVLAAFTVGVKWSGREA